MGFGFSYLIHPKNIKQKFRRKLQATKAITSIYKIIEVKDVKKKVLICENLCASGLLVLNMT
jgi:hypothetical protein